MGDSDDILGHFGVVAGDELVEMGDGVGQSHTDGKRSSTVEEDALSAGQIEALNGLDGCRDDFIIVGRFAELEFQESE